MNLRHYPAEELKKELLAIIGKQLCLDKYRIFFFGSRITGKGDDRADVDVGIEGAVPVPVEKMRAIKEAAENLPVLYKIDFVDFYSVSEDFKKVAMSGIEIIK
jgi:predicted nucleotidyltransferase